MRTCQVPVLVAVLAAAVYANYAPTLLPVDSFTLVASYDDTSMYTIDAPDAGKDHREEKKRKREREIKERER